MAAPVPGPVREMGTRAKIIGGLFLASGGMVLLMPPWTPAERFTFFGHGLCHQLPGHSYVIGGVQLPLCARCSGIYLGALLALVWYVVRGKGTSATLPQMPILLAMLTSFVFLGIDGINSYVNFTVNTMGGSLLGLGPVYEPQNLARILTGMFLGITIATLLLSVVNSALWEHPSPRPLVSGWGELAAMLGTGVMVALAVNAQVAWTAQPISLLIGLGLLAVFLSMNMLVTTTLLGREGKGQGLLSLAPAALLALGLALVELSLLAGLRTVLTDSLNLPF